MARPLRALHAVALSIAVSGTCLSCGLWLGPTVDARCSGGVPEGPYRLETDEVVVQGAYRGGAREGVFTFQTREGSRLAEIPYTAGRRNGVIRIWYRPEPVSPAGAHLRLEAEVDDGIWDGASRYYYEDGRPRAEYIYVRGILVGARAWNAEGELIVADEAETLARSDRVAEDRYLGVLEDALRANPPQCAR